MISHLSSERGNVRIMTSNNPKIEVLCGPERRRRWSTAEKLAIIQETYEPDATVSIVARRHGIQPNQLFNWRKLATQGALTATASEEEVVPASEYRALQNQVKELQRLLGKKTMEGEILKEALEIATGPKKHLLRSLSLPKGTSR
jgi:transposase